jgi:hypothetical protein
MEKVDSNVATITALNWMTELIAMLHSKGVLSPTDVHAIVKNTVEKAGVDKAGVRTTMKLLYPKLPLD